MTKIHFYKTTYLYKVNIDHWSFKYYDFLCWINGYKSLKSEK